MCTTIQTVGLSAYLEIGEIVTEQLSALDCKHRQWLEEILEEAKKAFGGQETLLPKTPCTKKKTRPRRTLKDEAKAAKRKLSVGDSEDEFVAPEPKNTAKQSKRGKTSRKRLATESTESQEDVTSDSSQNPAGTTTDTVTPATGRQTRASRAAARAAKGSSKATSSSNTRKPKESKSKAQSKSKDPAPVLSLAAGCGMSPVTADSEENHQTEDRNQREPEIYTATASIVLSPVTTVNNAKTPLKRLTYCAQTDTNKTPVAVCTPTGKASSPMEVQSTPENVIISGPLMSTPVSTDSEPEHKTPVERVLRVRNSNENVHTPQNDIALKKISSEYPNKCQVIVTKLDCEQLNVKEKIHMYEDIISASDCEMSPQKNVMINSEMTTTKPEMAELCPPSQENHRKSCSPRRSSVRGSLKTLPSKEKLSEASKPPRTRTRLRLKKTKKTTEVEQTDTEDGATTASGEDSQGRTTTDMDTDEDANKPFEEVHVQETVVRASTRTKTRQKVKEEANTTTSSDSSSEEKPATTRYTRSKQRLGTASVSSVDTDTTMDITDHSAMASKPRATRSKMRNPPVLSNTPCTPQRTTRTKTRKRQMQEDQGEEETEGRQAKRSCTEASLIQDIQKHHDENSHTDEDSSDSDYKSPSPRCPSNKVVRPHPTSFLNALKQGSNPLQPANLRGNVRSFIKCSTPVHKTSASEIREKLQKEIAEKQKKDEERIKKQKEDYKRKMDEMRKKREEKMRRAQEIRESKTAQAKHHREMIEKKTLEKNKLTEKAREDKIREERERQKLRQQKLQEAEERRRQEEEERKKKLLEQQEEQRRQEEFMRRKRVLEEQERQQKIAEESQKQAARLNEIEKQRQEEKEKLKKIEEDRAKEWQKRREERERILLNERIEKERQEMERRRELELQKKREMERARELEKKRLAEQEKEREELRKQREELKKMTEKHNQSVNPPTTTGQLVKPNLNKTQTMTPSTTMTSYAMTPVSSFDNYDITDLNSEDESDDEDRPRKPVPDWAQGLALKSMLIKQHFNQPNLHALFGLIEPPDLNTLFAKKKARFNKRTSSACWTSPVQPLKRL